MTSKKSIKDWGFNVISGWIPHKTAYGKALDSGHTLTETKFPSINAKADSIIQAIMDKATTLQSQNKAV